MNLIIKNLSVLFKERLKRCNFLTIGAIALVVLAGVFFIPGAKIHKPRIFDCFLFLDEIELLQIRLDELYPHVDKFVLVEWVETFNGKPKPLVYAQNKKLFNRFADKITYVSVHEHLDVSDPDKRQEFLRDQILRGLKECRKQDIVMISNIQEIIRGNAVAAIKKRLVEKHTDLVICEQKMYFGFLNRFQPAESPWHGSIATTYQRVKEISPHRLRKLREMKTKHLVKVSLDKWETIPDSGWHFSNIGGIERYKTHCDTCDYELPSQKTPQIIKNSIQLYPIVAIDASFPRFIREHKDYLTTIGLIDVQD